MTNKKTNSINWFWAHRRNSSLHHVNILAQGFRAPGFYPPLKFRFYNQIFIGIPQKGVYFFYDRNEIDKQYINVLQSIDSQTNFPQRFVKKNDLLFKNVLTAAKNFRSKKISKFNNSQLLKLFDIFIKNITKAPIITAQLWSIEACFSDKSPLLIFLKKWLSTQDKSNQLDRYKQLLCFSPKPSVAQKERMDFWQVIKVISSNKSAKKLFQNNPPKKIIEQLPNFQQANRKIKHHAKKYEWMNSEYRSGPWPLERWISQFKKSVNKNADQEINKIKTNHQKVLKNKKSLIRRMNPPKNVMQVIAALDVFVAKRDWAKGLFSQALLDYSFFLKELAKRIGLAKMEVLDYTIEEIREYLKTEKKVYAIELKRRKKGFAFYSVKGKQEIYNGKSLKQLIKKENIGAPFAEPKKQQVISGISANLGRVRAKVRVIENLQQLSDFKKGEIIVTYMTTMEFTPSFKKAVGVITDEGGLSSHAAIISREFNIPCLVGTKIATRVLKNGDVVVLDANKGLVKID